MNEPTVGKVWLVGAPVCNGVTTEFRRFTDLEADKEHAELLAKARPGRRIEMFACCANVRGAVAVEMEVAA